MKRIEVELEGMYQRDTKKRISLKDFAEYMYKETTHCKEYPQTERVKKLYKFITDSLDLNELNELVGILSNKVADEYDKEVMPDV